MFHAGARSLQQRTRRAFLAVTLATFALYAALFLHLAPDTGHADGYYSYLFARSLAFDGDVEMTNDYALCGDPFGVGRDRGTGHPDNQAYAGPALFWTPILLVARWVAPHAAPSTPALAGACRGPAVSAALFAAVVVGALAVGLSYLAARRVAGQRAALAAALIFAVASGLPHYSALFPAYSHVYACFACALTLVASLRAAQAEALAPWGLAGLACGLTALMRLSDACLALVPLALVAVSSATRGQKLGRAALVVAGTLAGVLPTLALYRYLYGSPWVVPQGRHFLQPLHAHPLLVLFAPHGGLFYATPVAWLAFAGAAVGLRARAARPLTVGMIAAFGVCLFVASSALDWHGKGTFGARRLLVMTPVLIVLAALALDRLGPLLRRHADKLGLLAALLLCGAPVVGSTFALRKGELPVERASPQSVQYGSGVQAAWAFVDERVGSLAIFPAEVVYALRYDLPMRSFRAATSDRFYRRSYHTLEWEPRLLPFADPGLLESSRGLALAPGGARLTGGDAALVFAAGWPHATDAELVVDAAEAGEIAISLGTFFGRCALGTRRVEQGVERHLAFSVPRGCFDSGLMEVRLRSSVPGLVLRQLAFDDSAVYPPPY